jgi:hypothetical protein
VVFNVPNVSVILEFKNDIVIFFRFEWVAKKVVHQVAIYLIAKVKL